MTTKRRLIARRVTPVTLGVFGVILLGCFFLILDPTRGTALIMVGIVLLYLAKKTGHWPTRA